MDLPQTTTWVIVQGELRDVPAGKETMHEVLAVAGEFEARFFIRQIDKILGLRSPAWAVYDVRGHKDGELLNPRKIFRQPTIDAAHMWAIAMHGS